MTNVSFALEAKSDQLNAMDIMGCDRIIRIRAVNVSKGDQPVSVFFDGDNNKPWKPSKGMLRILAGAWGIESSAWVGKHACLYFEPSVMYAGKEVGGIRIRSLSDINPKGLQFSLSINRQKREPYILPLLKVEQAEYPSERFNKSLPKMAEAMQKGEMTLQQVIAQCHKTGTLSPEQIKQLEQAAPVEINDDEEM